MGRVHNNQKALRILAGIATVLALGYWVIELTGNAPVVHLEEEDLFARTDAPVSYDISTPPSVGCEPIVAKLQQKLIEAYTPVFEGIRYINMWGYLETDNKGDAAIWIAQQMLLATLGIETMESCRFAAGVKESELCDLDAYRKKLEEYSPHSGIVMAGGGNFNDFYWLDQPQRIEIVNRFPEFPLRMFPQSIYMTNPGRIKDTYESFSKHNNLQLGARDQPSFDWLEKTFGPSEKNGPQGTAVMRTLTPDIVFMYGNRPDYRLKQEKKYDIFIMARSDREQSSLNEGSPQGTEGVIQLGRHKVTWYKKDWNDMPVPGLTNSEHGKNQRAFLKADEGFKILGRAELVVTDRLHGHIMSTVIGVPHILLDSKLGKNLALHDTWTVNCDCVRIAESWERSMEYAKLFFEKAYNEGRWTPSVSVE